MIIIEGCDNTGKTSLQQQVLERYPNMMTGYKQERPPEDKQSYMDRFWDFLGKSNGSTRNMVFDRFYFSELVYGPLLRGNVIFSPSENRMVRHLINEKSPLIIYCYRSPEQILSTFDEREQLEGVQERVTTIVNLYNEVFISWVGRENFVIYDYGNLLSVAQAWLKIEQYAGYHDHYDDSPNPKMEKIGIRRSGY